MPSINDVFDELLAVNANLATINTSVNAGKVATEAVKSSVDTLDGDVKSGFAATVAAIDKAVATLNIIAAIEVEEAKLLYHLTQQTDTMICALEHISKHTCELVTQSAIQTGLQTSMHANLGGLLAISQMVNPGAALEIERMASLRAEIHKCCPPETVPPACTYKPCPQPRQIGAPKLPQLPKTNDNPTKPPK